MQLLPLTDAEFRRLDYRVTEQVFASHNELGRFCDEVIYKNDIARRLQHCDLGDVLREVPAVVTHDEFRKTYYLDLVVGPAVIYEFKTATALTNEHQAQLLNYVLLLGGQRGKLFNLRPPSVEHFFINTKLTPLRRREFTIDSRRWQESDERSTALHRRLIALLNDWGAFLELNLYEEALTFFLGGEVLINRPVEISQDGVVLGEQRLRLLTPDTAFRLTALTQDQPQCEVHLRRFLDHTKLKALQWINFNHHEIELVTLAK
ncbi:MAG: GxxExxY protein [Verrucomicrobia bacterium]|nr:GxxExxY protein [Verrucomicrobiota bacterium]